MGIRFHRSIKIAKGVRLNFSKKGLGVSIGPRGAKISSGPSGVYSNIGIPGTGLYSRTKLSGPAKRKNSATGTRASAQTVKRYFEVEVSIDDQTGIEDVKFFDDGVVVTDASLLRKLRSEKIFKERLHILREKTCAEIEEKTHILTQIHKHAPPLPDWAELRAEASNQRPDYYVKEEFTIPKPDSAELYRKLEDEAYNTVKGFFGLKRKRQEYIDQRKDAYIQAEMEAWQRARQEFERAETEKETSTNKQIKQDFDAWKEEMHLTFNPTTAYLTEKLDQYLSEIQLPVDFSVSFEVLEDNKAIYLDIDLPEIEDYPQKKARILATGKVSVKNKTQKEKKLEYLRSVSGMSIYFASMVFSLSPVIEEVILSGYTQRINRASGNVEDEYVYSVKYDFPRFSKLDIAHIEPELTLQAFAHRMEVSAQYDLKTILPFEA